MAIFFLVVLTVLNSNFIYGQYNGFGYNAFDAAVARHGGRRNEDNGGTCKEFLELNSRGQCCANREDDCYMIHYDTRCYCDNFCNRARSDCCPDAIKTCNGGYTITEPPTTPELTIPTTEIPDSGLTEIHFNRNINKLETNFIFPTNLEGGGCEHNGITYNENEERLDNCNTV
jgi:hypothetical protein